MIYSSSTPEVLNRVLLEAEKMFGFSVMEITGRCREEPLASVRIIVANIMLEEFPSSTIVAEVMKKDRTLIPYYRKQHKGRTDFNQIGEKKYYVDLDYFESYNALKKALESESE